MSYTRRMLCQQAEQLLIPKKTIAARAGTGASNVSLYFGFGPIAQTTEDKISQAIRDISSFCRRFGDLRINLDDIATVNLFLSKLEMQSFVLMLTAVPTEFFLKRENGKVQTTRFLLEATAFNLPAADAIASDIKEEFPSVIVLDNPYCDKPQHAWVSDARSTPEYLTAMGLSAPQKEP